MRKIFVNPEKCTGCRICEVTCSMAKRKVCAPSKSLIRIVTWPKDGLSAPVVCRQCENAPCERACSVEAIRRDKKTGALLVNFDTCIGCDACVEACPFGAITLDDESGKAMKCDLCGGKPECVEICPTNAIDYTSASEFAYKRGESLAKKERDLDAGGKA